MAEAGTLAQATAGCVHKDAVEEVFVEWRIQRVIWRIKNLLNSDLFDII